MAGTQRVEKGFFGLTGSGIEIDIGFRQASGVKGFHDRLSLPQKIKIFMKKIIERKRKKVNK